MSSDEGNEGVESTRSRSMRKAKSFDQKGLRV